MKKMFKRGLCAALAAVLFVTMVPLSVSKTFAATIKPDATVNLDAQEYDWNWSDTVNSYLFARSDGSWNRLVYNSSKGKLVSEIYSSSFSLRSKKKLSMKLPIIGGAYSGTEYNYIVFGQVNTSASDKKEVFRIVKYTKDWDYVSHVSLYGENTTIPFDAGSCRMTESNGYLYIRTCHEMYNGHQANVQIQVRTSDMVVTSKYTDVMNVSYGYVSHSFNQFITTDALGNVITLDHGDAYPRAAVLMKYAVTNGESMFDIGALEEAEYSSDTKDADHAEKLCWRYLMEYAGATGDNATGATLGGLESSAAGYITAGTTVKQDKKYASNDNANVYVTFTPNTITSENEDVTADTNITYLTDYSEKSKYSATTPQLVKFSDDLFLVMWGVEKGSSKTYYYAFVNGSGQVTQSARKMNGLLSDCHPTVSGSSAYWYVTTESGLYFFRMKSSGKLSVKMRDISSVSKKIKRTKSVSVTKKGKNSIDISWKKPGGGAFCQIECSTSPYFYPGTTSTYYSYIYENTLKQTLGGLKKKTTYYIRVRGGKYSAGGTAHYGAWSKVKKAKTK